MKFLLLCLLLFSFNISSVYSTGSDTPEIKSGIYKQYSDAILNHKYKKGKYNRYMMYRVYRRMRRIQDRLFLIRLRMDVGISTPLDIALYKRYIKKYNKLVDTYGKLPEQEISE